MIWIVAATFGRDHIGAYGNPTIRTPSPDALAGRAIRFDRHYSAGFPTVPTKADHQTGRWTMSFMGWKPLPSEATILAEILAGSGFHTAASVDTWDPHEPWDAPSYYTELYWPGHDGELALPVYGNWHDVPGYAEDGLRKGHATCCGEVIMADTWLGFLLKSVENMGLANRTVVIFTTDHGFYFGEHGGLFGKMSSDKYPDGTLRPYGESGSTWTHSPMFEELVHIPLLLHVPGLPAGRIRA